ncbi:MULTISPECIES: acyl-CoA reductase [unclassified Arcicella]|uniref:acyl-CoA reductase n=1 Tax=unclassified Arcicella TaxID=2644986 RepID=UPI002866EA79|nr:MULTISPECIES: acyl-CoA reductase [unclassified Arcicella]MDR6561868.1 quinol monooxygenase YgiN [Arcicella sp. BE51]MDR6814014.1 quinol monooxygenase YgiN [Arcicella sp. BE140]MDR6825279.1 quinol monooxygenase YgiN [Arcicella sp. BE139]
MDLQARIETFVSLGNFLRDEENQSIIEEWADRASHQNNWFTPQNTKNAIKSITDFYLDRDTLERWVGLYEIPDRPPIIKSIGVIMAGNIPAVGFHDLLTVVIAGHDCVAKVSSQDSVLMLALIEKLLEISPTLGIRISERMNEVDALIATGSDNSARYFEYYFRNKAHIIRQNRSSVAILNGSETEDDFFALGKDITDYYGLGCRNISKFYVPEDYDFVNFYDTIEPLGDVFYHNKYKNNYDYNKSIYLVNQVHHYDNGFLILTKNESLVSPISVIFYETYENEEDLKQKIADKTDKIQCIVSKEAWFEGSIPFGETQMPKLWDYADGVDTMLFLLSLND